MRRKSGVLRGLALLLVLIFGVSQASAEALDRAQMAQRFGSERLRLFTLGQAMQAQAAPRQVTQAMRQALERAGYYQRGITARSLRFSPVLAWDGNINGGYLNDTLDLFGLQFQVAPANLARSGWVLGGRSDGFLRYALAEGRTLDLSTSVEAAWSPRHEIGRANAGLELCLRNPLGGWNFADLCAGSTGSWRALSDSHSETLSLRLSHLLVAGNAAHELSLEVEERWLQAGRQTGLVLGWGTAWDHAVTDFRVGVATPIAGEQATRLQVSARASWLWGARPVSVSLWHMRASGGQLLGMARDDAQTGIGLSLQARPGLTLDVTHQVTRSSIGLFNEARTGLGVRFQLGRS
ncbi:hypothetical protein LCM17_17075 [Cereibacter sphaeroides]|nr:hypothetical protein [Cereibacter sphaeroides]